MCVINVIFNDAIEADRLTVLSQEETIDEDIDPISSIVEEIVKNETIIGDEEFVPSPESSIIKFKDENLANTRCSGSSTRT